MAQYPALMLWTDAYLADTTHLTTIEHGAYMLLLMAAWRSKDCSLPNDDKLLARYAKLTLGQWKRMKPTILSFFDLENNRLYQSRLTDEREAVKKKSKGGKNGAAARWLKNKDSVYANASNPQSGLNADGMATTTTTTTIESPLIPLWGKFRDLYPDRQGKEKYLSAAEEIFFQLIEDGERPENILAGLEEYANFIKGTNGKHLAKTATAFLKNKIYMEYLKKLENRPEPKIAEGVDGEIWKKVFYEWKEVGTAYSWLSNIKFCGIQNGSASFIASSRFMRDKITQDLSSSILQRLKDKDKTIKKIIIDYEMEKNDR